MIGRPCSTHRVSDASELLSYTVTVGGNFRYYLPNSRGNIFSDTANTRITNSEFGLYTGVERTVLAEKLKLTATLRVDKNINFPFVFSPAASAVYSFNPENILRFSFSSAMRNPTLQDQYLYYNVRPGHPSGQPQWSE